MSTPVLYASVSDLRLILDSTDAGTGTAAQLTDAQLNLALQAGSDRVSVYAGQSWDPAAAPFIAHDLTLDLAAWWATTYYLKQHDMGAAHPVVLRYDAAMKVLDDVRSGKIDLNDSGSAAGAGAPAGAAANVINKIPNIFTGDDSNTAVDPGTGYLYAAQPPDMGPKRDLPYGDWLEYQG